MRPSSARGCLRACCATARWAASASKPRSAAASSARCRCDLPPSPALPRLLTPSPTFSHLLGGGVFGALQRALGANFEAFASPLNTYYGAYCSAFPDVDAPFGSAGPFAALRPARGSYQVNPPFVPPVIDAAAEHILGLLERAQASGRPQP